MPLTDLPVTGLILSGADPTNVAEIDAELRAHYYAEAAADTARLVTAARDALAALDDLIYDHTDPGSAALGARYLFAQALVRYPDAEKPDTAPDAEAMALLRNRLAFGFAREDVNWGYDHGFCKKYGLDPETDAFVDVAVAALAPLLAACTGQEG